ncbi:7474_t:CDS:2 [Entrophospora sp. SA101]|nr:7474_t:CDS:2 [Entrophospora sp. SA101]
MDYSMSYKIGACYSTASLTDAISSITIQLFNIGNEKRLATIEGAYLENKISG